MSGKYSLRCVDLFYIQCTQSVVFQPHRIIACSCALQDTYGPPMGKRLLMFVDDLNMPRVDTYGTQQPIALLKMFVERKGYYDRGKELGWKNIKDVQMVSAMGPPGGARNPVDPRFISLFAAVEIQPPTNENLRTIYQVSARQQLCWYIQIIAIGD